MKPAPLLLETFVERLVVLFSRAHMRSVTEILIERTCTDLLLNVSNELWELTNIPLSIITELHALPVFVMPFDKFVLWHIPQI